MERSKLDQLVSEDLARIPRGAPSQNILRSAYNMQRRSDLSRNPTIPARKSLLASIALVRHGDPAFVASVDEKWFGLDPVLSAREG